ncbi:MAG: P1 family peptidase [Actinomycetota bacterium]|nr:P1 family peptidase [Actinomycetota bacterium]
MSEPLVPPAGFRIGHWTDPVGMTGCTVVIAPEGTRGGVDVRGGGPGTRETDVIGPLAGTDRVSAVTFAGGSAYGLAAADGVMAWLEEQGIGYPTPAGIVPIVPAAIVYDLAAGDPRARPDAAAGRAACEAAREGVPDRGAVGSGTGTAAGKAFGREQATPTGVGYAAARGGFGATMAALAVVNPFGDVLAEGGGALAGSTAARTGDMLAALDHDPIEAQERNTTLVCLMTDASLDKAACGRVARAAGAGIARSVEPVFTDVDGDVVFCLASGEREPGGRFEILQLQALAARITADAIRDAAA